MRYCVQNKTGTVHYTNMSYKVTVAIHVSIQILTIFLNTLSFSKKKMVGHM